jgi:AAA15 family ATPase/GTPase
MDNSKHIREFTIENYRRFVDFKVENIGQFNLIVGDNNSGKTSLLECVIYMDFNKLNDLLAYIQGALYFRNNEIIGKSANNNEVVYQYFESLTNDQGSIRFSFISGSDKVEEITLRKYNHESDFELLNEESQELIKFDSSAVISSFIIKHNNVYFLKSLTSMDFKFTNNFIPFIPFGLGYGSDILKFYSEIQKNRKEKDVFIENVKTFISSIEDINIDIVDGLNIVEKNVVLSKPLFSYGEGANKMFRILLELAKCKNRKLMIDEIDTGVHHSRFLSFWKTILQVAKNYNVQLFATTHNEECISYYRQALEELESENSENKELFSDEARLISLREVKEDVRAFTYNLHDMQYADEVGRELRGA